MDYGTSRNLLSICLGPILLKDFGKEKINRKMKNEILEN